MLRNSCSTLSIRNSLSSLVAGAARARLHAALALATLLVAGACDSRRNVPTGTGNDRPVRFSLAASISAAPGAVVEAIVSFTPPGGSAIIVGRDSLNVDTGTADAALVLTVNVAGCLAAANGGDCVLTLTVRLKRNGVVLDELTRVLRVAPAASEIAVPTMQLFEVSSIRITPSTVTGLEPGDSVPLVASALDRAGGTVASRTVAWSVVGAAATVSANGTLRAVAPGLATVRASIGGRTQDLVLTVGPSTVASLTLAPADTAVLIGGSVTYRVTARSSSGAVLTGRTVTFSSLQPTIATINAAGIAVSVAPGTATIRVVSNEGRNGAVVSATTSLRVDPIVIAVNPTSLNFDTEINQPLPPAQTVAVTNSTGGNAGALSLVTPIDTLLTATLNGTTAPTTLTIRPARALAPGTVLTRSVVVRSSNAAVASVTVLVNLTGRTPAALSGRFSGVVIAAANQQPIGQATVTIRTQSNVQVAQAFTAVNGAWTSAVLPAGTYNITVSNAGFQDVQVLGQLLVGGANTPTTALATVSLVSITAGAGTIQGSVRDATTGNARANATVELRLGANNTVGTPLAVTSTNSDGQYLFPSRPAGTYTIRALSAGFAEGNVFVVVTGSNVTAPVVFLSPAGQNVAWRFVLSWSASPQDLDAHLTGPITNSNNRFHVYFADTGSVIASPFARLDVDVVSGFGPETITMSQQIAGVYRYYVHNFSAETPLKSSNARLDVYQGSTLIRQFFPPQQDGVYWTVFELNGSSLTTVGTIGSLMPAVMSPTIGPRRHVDSARERAATEWYQLGPWTWSKPKAPSRR